MLSHASTFHHVILLVITFKVATCLPVEKLKEDDGCFPTPSNVEEVCPSFWGGKKPPVILISLDGFRPEYMSRTFPGPNPFPVTPTIQCLAKKGVHAPSMMPSFPTITFPNHHSIVTGLYPESHGIVGNQFYDPHLKTTFDIQKSNHMNPMWWNSGQSIWATMRKQGKISAMYMWPGSNVPLKTERTPNHFVGYNRSIALKERVDQVLKWMDLPASQRPDLTALYSEEPDSTAHRTGPNSYNVTEKLLKVDTQLRRMVDRMLAKNIFGCINLIVVSDHGMAAHKRSIDLENFIPDLKKTAITFHGTLTSVRPMNSSTGEMDRLGKAMECKHQHMRVFDKYDLPYRLHSVHSTRIPSLMLDVDLTWRTFFRKDPLWNSGGSHGWDNLYQEMQAIFVAHGPSFKSNYVAKPFENVQLYNLMCALVDVSPAANNGTWGALHHLLTDPPAVELDGNIGGMPQILRLDDGYDFIAYDRSQDMCNNLNDYVQTETSSEEYINDNNDDGFYLFNNTEEVEDQLLNIHAPLGIPLLSPTTNISNYGLLINEGYIAGFSVSDGTPLWTAYTINRTSISAEAANKMMSWRSDPRLGVSGCNHLDDFTTKRDAAYIHIFPKEFALYEEEAWLDTNLLELPSRTSHLVKIINELLKQVASRYESINVITGLTHHHSAAIFYVVSACDVAADGNQVNLSTCPLDLLRLQAFLIPVESKFNQACIEDYQFVALHVASLKDVERVTKFNFFPDLSGEDKLDLLTRTTLSSHLLVDPCRYSNLDV